MFAAQFDDAVRHSGYKSVTDSVQPTTIRMALWHDTYPVCLDQMTTIHLVFCDTCLLVVNRISLSSCGRRKDRNIVNDTKYFTTRFWIF